MVAIQKDGPAGTGAHAPRGWCVFAGCRFVRAVNAYPFSNGGNG